MSYRTDRPDRAEPIDQARAGTRAEPETQPPARLSAVRLNVGRLVVGALAAVTAAALSSRLGVTGTLVGTAIISFVTGLASTIYQQSAERTRQALAVTRDRAGVLVSARTGRRTAVGEVGDDHYPAPVAMGDSPPRRPPLRDRVAGYLHSPRRRFALAGGAAALTFVVAFGIITVIELAGGRELSGGHHTTTIGAVVGAGGNHVSPQRPPSHRPPDQPPSHPTAPATASTGPSASPSPSGSPTGSPSGSPSGSASGSPTASPSGSPTASPSRSPTGSPSGSPTASPSGSPTGSPSGSPTASPSGSPTASPSGSPTASPSGSPTGAPSPRARPQTPSGGRGSAPPAAP